MNLSKIFKLSGWNYTALVCSDLLIFDASFSQVFKHINIFGKPLHNLSQLVFSQIKFLQTPLLSKPQIPNHCSCLVHIIRITESFILEKNPKKQTQDHRLQPLTDHHPVNWTTDGTECHIQSSHEQLQGWWLLHSSGQFIPMLSNPLHEGILPQEGCTQECCWLSTQY